MDGIIIFDITVSLCTFVMIMFCKDVTGNVQKTAICKCAIAMFQSTDPSRYGLGFVIDNALLAN